MCGKEMRAARSAAPPTGTPAKELNTPVPGTKAACHLDKQPILDFHGPFQSAGAENGEVES